MGRGSTDKLAEQLEAVKTEIARLEGFRDTPFARKFRRQLEGEKSVILARLKKITATQEEKETETIRIRNHANRMRSEKMKRTWRYLKSIQQNYHPEKSLKELRTALRKHRQGLENDVSDVAWRNASP